MTWSRRLSWALLFMALIFGVAGVVWRVTSDRVVVVGFLGPLEGKYSDLGVQGRNGVSLALEQANDRGAVPGVSFRLVSRDAGSSAGEAARNLDLLAASGAVAVIGPMTSVEAEGAIPAADAAHLPLISPTVASPRFTGKADCFFRVISDNRIWAADLARWCRLKDGRDTAFIVADADNAAYTRTFSDVFRQEFTRLGGQISGELAIHAAREPFLGRVLAAIDRLAPTTIVTVLAARDLAALAAALHTAGLTPAIYSSMWAYTRELLTAGGRSLDGIIFVTGYPMQSAEPAYQRFSQDYRQRFGFEPNFAAALGFEAADMLVAALAAVNGHPEGLMAALTRPGVHPGLIGNIPLDANGDCVRTTFIETVADGAFTSLGRAD